ncbi:MAG: Mut7-C RNAse domain-containing protein [Candidatus Thermoplasmatota archaeon]|nr:Mut7-C RNAse domain-containing protein [Candidatus Thermoplasmatota archaeon]
MTGVYQTGKGSEGSPVFCADGMLGKLARWLRFMGFDTVYAGSESTDKQIISYVRDRGMILLTSDRLMASMYRDSVLIRSNVLSEQIREVISRFMPDPGKFMSRCSVCNSLLHEIKQEKVDLRVPDSVKENHLAVMECPGCGRLYWHGTHYPSILMKLNSILRDYS